MEINSHILKLQGRAELPHEIETGHNYHTSLEGSVSKVELHDNEDSTWNKIYTFRPIKIEVLDPKGKSLKLKDPRKNSAKIRAMLWKQYFNEGISEDFDLLYDAVTMEIMLRMSELMEAGLKRLNK